jgi:hypothetical protein
MAVYTVTSGDTPSAAALGFGQTVTTIGVVVHQTTGGGAT